MQQPRFTIQPSFNSATDEHAAKDLQRIQRYRKWTLRLGVVLLLALVCFTRAGFDRSSADGFRDYFRQLTEYEPRRAAMYGIRHFTWLCINPKESEDLSLATDVLSIIPEFMDNPNVLGIGEIGEV